MLNQGDAHLDVLHEDGSLVVDGRVALAGLPASADLRSEDGGVIVGLKSMGGHHSCFDVALGQLCCERFLALAKSSLYWMSPMFGATASEVPRETQFLLLSLPGGACALLLPLIDGGAFRATLRPSRAGLDSENTLVLRIESGDDSVMASSWGSALYVCAGWDPFEVVERGVPAAARLSGGAKPSQEKEASPALDVFGWCSWDAFYSRVSAAGLQEGLGSLAEGGVPPRLLIIDDGWQQTDVDPGYRDAATQSLVSGMGHMHSGSHSAAVEEAAADLLAGTDMRQREELIGLHELEEETMTPRPQPPPGVFLSLPTTPTRRYWGETPGSARRGSGGGMLTPAGIVPRGAMTSPRLAARPLGASTSSPRIAGPGLLPPSSSCGSLGSLGGTPHSSDQPGALSPRMGALHSKPFLPSPRVSGSCSPLLSPLQSGHSPFRTFDASQGGPTSPQLAPPPEPEVLAKQLEEATAVVVHVRVPPLRTPSTALPEGLRFEAPPAAAAAAKGDAGKEGAAEVEKEALVPAPIEASPLGLLGHLLGLLRRAEVAALHWASSLLKGATSDSWRMRLFSALATGPLRSSILRFYVIATDHSRRLQSVKANTKFSHPEAGPEHPLSSSHGEEGLKSVIAHLKQQYGVQYVYCWHAMMGFWAGVAPEAEHTAKYAPRMVYPKPTKGILEIDPSYAWVQPVLAGVGLPQDPVPLHRDMHAYLKGCGVDGVKVDVQGTVGLVGSAAGGAAALSASYHASLEDSVRQHFPGNHCINCMCGSSEDIYRMAHTNQARVSDDFYPHLPASWTAHIAHCALNSLFCGELVVPDWDMFHSVHPAALLHAAARAISGGPVYVSDRPGIHDFAVLGRLVLPDGSVLRCARHARPTRDCLFRDVLRDGASILKLWNLNPHCGMLGLFNIQGSSWSIAHRGFTTHDPAPPDLVATVAPSDVARLRLAEAYAVYRDSTQELLVMGRDERMSIQVEGGGGWELLTVSPVLKLAGVRVAPIGLPHMLNCGGAVLSVKTGNAPASAAHIPFATTIAPGTPPTSPRASISSEEPKGEEAALEDGAGTSPGDQQPWQPQPQQGKSPQEHTSRAQGSMTFALEVKGPGELLCYASQRPLGITADGRELAFIYDPASGALSIELPPTGPVQKSVVLCFAAAATVA